jgi:hypothetical protein
LLKEKTAMILFHLDMKVLQYLGEALVNQEVLNRHTFGRTFLSESSLVLPSLRFLLVIFNTTLDVDTCGSCSYSKCLIALNQTYTSVVLVPQECGLI